MKRSWLKPVGRALTSSLLLCSVAAKNPPAPAANRAPTVQEMLELKPTQRFVDYDIPSADQLPAIKAELLNEGKAKIWVLRDATGRTYRRFVDSDRNGVVDQWVYFRDGVEVYRDIDSNSNGRADQFRWTNSGGTRWAVDSNEDGKFDGYRYLSPAEATREVLRAIQAKDLSLLDPVMVRPADAPMLGRAVTPERIKELNDKSRQQFSTLAKELSGMALESTWVRFECSIPMLLAGEAPDGSRDIEIYRNCSAVIQTGTRTDVLQFSEIVVIGKTAKIVELPTITSLKNLDVVMNNAEIANVPAAVGQTETPSATDTELQAILTELTTLDAAAIKGANDNASTARYQLKRAEILVKLAERAKSDQDRLEWQKQQADSLIAAIQVSTSEEATERLNQFYTTVSKQEEGQNGAGLAGYIAFRRISAEYFRKLQAPGSDFAAVQTEWLLQLDKFVGEFPKAEDAAEALSQLAIGNEFTGKEDEAKQYYQKLVESFPESPQAQKARGSTLRLDLVGKPFALRGSNLRGSTVDVQQFRGKVVLIDYWATTCDPWKADLPKLKELYTKYHSKGFEIIGVSLDNEKGDVAKLVQTGGIPWPVVFEAGGLESPPALQYGVLALPTQFLVDSEGTVVSRSIHVSQLEEELKKLLK